MTAVNSNDCSMNEIFRCRGGHQKEEEEERQGERKRKGGLAYDFFYFPPL